MRVSSSNTKGLLLLCLCVISGFVYAQNLNNPNKVGPLGTQVNTVSGNIFIKRTDISIPARKFNLEVSFFYNSFLFNQEYGFGRGWTFQYNIRYKNDTTGARLILWGDGREDTYDSLPGGLYKSPKGFFSTLSQYQAGKYVIKEPDGRKYYFDNAVHKRITKMEEPNGNYINFNYNDSLLTAITNNAGQTISFTYNPQGRLATIVDAIASPSRTFTYTYDSGGNLKEVKDPLNGKCRYEYLVNGPMKSLADKNNNKVDLIYFPDFTAREIIGCNKRISISYDTASKTNIVTDYLSSGNQVTKYTYQTVDNLSWITRKSGNCCGFNVSYEYDGNGNVIKMTDANGQIYTYTYDSLGNLLTATDPLGNISTYAYTSDFQKLSMYKDPKGNIYTMNYDSKGNMTQLITPGNNVYTATYNAQGDIVASTDAKGNQYAFNYDSYGNPVSVTGPNGYHATISFDARGNMQTFIDARGNNTTVEYDILSRMKKITDPINNSIQLTYDAQGNVQTYKNKNNETVQLNYDASNRVVNITGPTGNRADYTYDGMDNLLSIKNALGNETRMYYDKLNRLSSIKDADNNNTVYDYDANGNLIRAGLPNGQVYNYSYDALNRLSVVSDGISNLANYTYDKNGNVIKYINATGAVTTAIYDSLNRIISITDPLGNTKGYVYDKNSNIITIRDREGRASHYTYDSLNRVKTFTDNNGYVLTVGYDTESNVVALTDQNNNVTTFTYDDLNRRKKMIFPDASYKEFTYDNENNITAIRLTDGTSIIYTYDTLNRVTSRAMPGGEIYSYTYDKLNRVLSATNNAGTVVFAYDKLNRVISETFDGRTITYQYNVSGRSQTTIYPDNTKVVKEFDTRNRITKILKDSVIIAEYTYNNLNQLTNKTFENGISTTMQYDFANRLSNILTSNGIQNTSYTYDKEYNKTAINRLNNPALSEQFTYDNGYRLTNYKRGPSGSPVLQNSYTYDGVGNRSSANLNGTATSYTTNNLNQITAVNGVNLTYDGRGNMIYDGLFYKTYDAENRLIKDSSSPVSVITYAYDALGRRTNKVINGISYKYTYSGAAQIEERDGANNLLNRTVFANFLSPVMSEKNGNKFYFHSNELNSVEAITNRDGRLIESYRYDVYGKPALYDSLNSPLSSSLIGNRFGFTGQEFEKETNSYHFFFRNYSPETGVFNQRDPIEYRDGTGMYQYVNNNPSNGIDILGLEIYMPEFDPPKPPKKPGDCPEAGTDFMSIWDKMQDTKSYIEVSTGVNVFDFLPKGITRPMDVAGPFIDLYKTANSVNAAAGTNSVTLQNMHGGDAMKNGTNATLGLVGLTGSGVAASEGAAASATILGFGGTAAEASAAGAFAAEASVGSTVAAGAGQIGLIVFTVDKGSEVIFRLSETEKIEHQSFLNDLDTREYLWKQGADDAERVQRIMRLDQLEKMKLIRDYLNNNPCPDGGTKKKFRLVWDDVSKMWVLLPIDPNLIIGPDGVPGKKWVSVKDRMPYTIMFENDSTATARSRYIKITTPIEPKQDPATLELGNFGFNNQSFEVPPGLSTYYERLDARDSTGVYVDVVAGYDVLNNQVFWEFRAIDPVTLLPPDDPYAGFLFLKDTANPSYGQGFVDFTMKPLSSSHTLDTIGARAFITFDDNETIPTNIHTNTIDAVAPVSQMISAITDAQRRTTLTWAGADDASGSGVDYYTVYVSGDGVNFSILIPEIRRTDTTLTLPPDSAYCFFVLATDRVKNVETLRPNVTKCITGIVTLPVTWLYFNGNTQGKNNILTWATASETNTKDFRLERSLNGNTFTEIAVLAAAGNSTTTREYRHTDLNIDRLNSERMYYRVKQTDLDGRFSYSRVVVLTYRENGTQPSIVYPNPTRDMINILAGDKKLVGTEAVLMDVNGRILQKFKLTAVNHSIDLGPYVNGVYFILLDNKETLRVVKQ